MMMGQLVQAMVTVSWQVMGSPPSSPNMLTAIDNLQAIGDPGQRTGDVDLIRPQTTLNITEAHHVDASHGTFIQGSQTNVFSKTTNTYIYTRA